MPFAQSWRPSARAKVAGAPVVVGVGNIEPGRMIAVKWRGKPVWILRHTDLILRSLERPAHIEKLRDPDSVDSRQPSHAQNVYRSSRPEIFVAVSICTHLGCVPTYMSDSTKADESGMYYCPCYGSRFDLAGRVFKNVPAPTNLVVPPHRYIAEDILKIGSA